MSLTETALRLPGDDERARVPDERVPFSVLILNDELPIFPGSGGVEYLTTRALAPRCDHVGLVSMAHRRRDLDLAGGLRDAGVSMYLWESPFLDGVPTSTHAPAARRLHQWFARAVQRWKAWPDRPLDVVMADGSFRNMSHPLVQALSARAWPVVSVVQTHEAHIIDYVPEPALSVLVMHDVRARIFERRAQIAATARERRWCLRQAARYHEFERRYCRRYDLVVTVSDTDAAYVRQEYHARRVVTRRLPVDTSYYMPASPASHEPGMIIFTGLMNHAPNADAAVFMARDVLPRIQAKMPSATFWIVGRHPAPEVAALASLPGVHVTGEVPDVRPYLARATVVVVPLRYGSGARQKILEAWSMQKCIVSTTIGAEGLTAVDGVHLSLADAPEAIASQVLRALTDEAWRTQISHAGRTTAIVEHDPERIARAYVTDLSEALTAKRHAMEPMRVALDLRWLIPGLAGGIEHVARALLRELLAIDAHNYYTLILPAQTRDAFDLRGHPRVRVNCPESWETIVQRAWLRLRRRLHAALRLDFWESPDVLQLRWLRSLDARFSYSFPGYTFPDVWGLPQVLMVPDIQHEYCPEFFTPESLEERTRVYRGSIERATHLTAISEFTRQTLIDKLGVPPERVTTILLAADPIFRAAQDEGLRGDGSGAREEAAADRDVLHRHDLEAGGYLFFPGHTWHHKNHAAAIAALQVLRERHGLRLPLVCTGGAREAQPAIHEAIKEAGVDGEVRFLGYCERGDLPALYRGAACLVFPSLFEGFGMPVLEAMACGCPVVCSNTTSLPEIAGDAARLVDPRDPDAIAAAIADIVRDGECREAMRRRGFTQAARFSWRRHTLETLRVFRAVHQRVTGGTDVHD
jgi:glycosyltransferase involved in cell wall biosynthesis